MRLHFWPMAALSGICMLCFYGAGVCQELQEEEITWEDIEGINSSPRPTVPPQAAQSSVPKVSAKPEVAQEPSVLSIPQSHKAQRERASVEPLQAAPELKSVTAQPSRKAAPAPRPKQRAPKKVGSLPKEPVSEEESAWSHAAAITGEGPSIERDIFVTNPERE
jgi:hypothetical protein